VSEGTEIQQRRHQQEAGTIAREDLTSREFAMTAEIQATSAAAQVTAEVNARYGMALKNPRNMGQVRQALLAECKRPRFAEVARYALPRGNCKECKGRGCGVCDGTGKNMVRGWTIRFAEACMRALKNVYVRTAVVADSPQKRSLAVGVLDLESNTTYSADVVFEKTVERRGFFRDGKEQAPAGNVVAVRKNSYGDNLYVVVATDEEVNVKQAALVSKMIRTLLLRIVPGDLLDEALDEVHATVAAGDAAVDPAADRKKLEDAFAALGVSPVMLASYLGCPLEARTPAQGKLLKGVYQSLKAGETTWAEVVRMDDERPGEPDVKADAVAKPAPKKSVSELKAEAKTVEGKGEEKKG
jgi:hypothetical protein